MYLVGVSGQPQSAHAFGCWFIRRCREAGLARSAHGLRKLGAQRCAEAGATEHQLMALFGCALMEFGDFALLRAMLQGIKQRAEALERSSREIAAQP